MGLIDDPNLQMYHLCRHWKFLAYIMNHYKISTLMQTFVWIRFPTGVKSRKQLQWDSKITFNWLVISVCHNCQFKKDNYSSYLLGKSIFILPSHVWRVIQIKWYLLDALLFTLSLLEINIIRLLNSQALSFQSFVWRFHHSICYQIIFSVLAIPLWAYASGILNDLCSSECTNLFKSPSALERLSIIISQVNIFLFFKLFFKSICLPQIEVIISSFCYCVLSEYSISMTV